MTSLTAQGDSLIYSGGSLGTEQECCCENNPDNPDNPCGEGFVQCWGCPGEYGGEYWCCIANCFEGTECPETNLFGVPQFSSDAACVQAEPTCRSEVFSGPECNNPLP